MSARLLVCGGRDYTDRARVFSEIDTLHRAFTITAIIHGGARGADSLAGEWAADRGVAAIAFLADWARNGRAAGPIRNALMLSEGQPDIVLAFPGGRGTEDMMRRALAAGVDLVTVFDLPECGHGFPPATCGECAENRRIGVA